MDTDHRPLKMVNVTIKGRQVGTITNDQGEFALSAVSGESIYLVFSFVGFRTAEREVILSDPASVVQILEPNMHRIGEVVVGGAKEQVNIVAIQPQLTQRLPTMAGHVETLVKTQPGVGNHNELSSQYSVRGGNLDENLVYINGVEIIRPFLVKSGEQEGLSIIDGEMVSAIGFSSGGFDASFGDKMSSVLDITYKKPTLTSVSAEIGALGASTHLQGSALKGKFSHISGFRYKNTNYLLGTLDKKGEYNPSFLDFQTYLNYQFSPLFSFGFLGNYAANNYQFIPETQLTRFGTMLQPYEFYVYFEGRERDRFENYMGVLDLDYRPNHRFSSKLQLGMYNSYEKETYDILGEYYLNDIDQSCTSSPIDSSLVIGVGSYLNHARNAMTAKVYSIEHRGAYGADAHRIQWGLKFQREQIFDKVNEWEMRDSAGYSIPYSDTNLDLYQYVSGNSEISSNRYSAFIQDNWTSHPGNGTLILNGGIRMQNWDYNHQSIFSPRLSATWKIGESGSYIIHAAWGVYQQMPFFKELKNRQAQLVDGVKAQKSIHYLIGYDHLFSAFDRPFRFSTEIWYKALPHLIPYQIDNLNISYLPEQQSVGYAGGVEFKINGEFVQGAQSWASLSFMKTEEDILGDAYITSGAVAQTGYPGYIPRPSDQRVNFSLFFQDYFPGYPSVKMNMTLFYGSRLPFGPPQGERYMDTFRMPSYRRADVGFSKDLINTSRVNHPSETHRFLKQAWIGLELFNLFDINNTISYYWITDIKNQMHAVPNYLTGRRINIKFSARF